MIANLFFYLIAAGFMSEVAARTRIERIGSIILFAVFALLLLNFYENWQVGYTGSFAWHWIATSLISVNIDLSSTPSNYALIAPFFLMSGLMVLNNIFYPQENDKLRLNGLLSLNMAAIMLMVCSHNFMQLLTAVCMIDVLSLFMINDIEGKRRYVFYNLLADMGLFTMFAVIWGQTANFDLSALSAYHRTGQHPELTAVLLLFCVFIKCGLFLFQGGLLNLSNLGFNRLIAISYCATPVSGILLLVKAHPLLTDVTFAPVALQLFAAVSLVWGMIGAVSIDNIKEKALYFNIMFYALLIGLMSVSLATALQILPLLLVLGYLLNSLWMGIVISASNEVFVSNMGGFIQPLKISFGLALLLFWALIQVLYKQITPQNEIWLYCFSGCLLLGAAHTLYQIFFGQTHADDRVWAFLKNSSASYLLPLPIIVGGIIFSENFYSSIIWYVFAGFLLVTLIGPLRFLGRLYEFEKVQSADWLDDIYKALLIAPVKILGRILWLTIDFLIIERTMISSLTGATNLLIRVSNRLHTRTWLSGILFTLLGLSIFAIVLYLKAKK